MAKEESVAGSNGFRRLLLRVPAPDALEENLTKGNLGQAVRTPTR